MTKHKATALAHPNIAFIKYWGNQGSDWNLPFGNSISMNLDAFTTTTTVEFDYALTSDQLTLNGQPAQADALIRIQKFMDCFRQLTNFTLKANITSDNNFPTGAGIASSAAGFAALALASYGASGLPYTEKDTSALARIGSGSASRSIPTGYTEWLQGTSHETSYSISIVPQNHWDLIDNLVLIDSKHKKTTSKQGHQIAKTSPLQQSRIETIQQRVDICKQAIIEKDFITLADISEADTLLMHAVMMSSNPALFYLAPETLSLIKFVRELRAEHIDAFYTIDAGANVHVITTTSSQAQTTAAIQQNFPNFEIRSSKTGGPARLI
jgi:diphosphomevalonate decarboxylase